jgi:hypothetical protein
MRELTFDLPTQIEIAEAVQAATGAHKGTVRRMAVAIDLLRDGGWEVVKRDQPSEAEVRAARFIGGAVAWIKTATSFNPEMHERKLQLLEDSKHWIEGEPGSLWDEEVAGG